MIRVIDINGTPRTVLPEGRVRSVLSTSQDGTRVHVGIADIDGGKTLRFTAGERTQLAYILDGNNAVVTHTTAGRTSTSAARRGTGAYLEPGEEATIGASASPLVVLLVSVPKYTGRAAADASPAGYVFEESRLRALVDEKQFRERTFWVNKETGLSQSWDLQIGRMAYAPHAHSPRHVHHASKTSAVTPEHFYLIERGTGEVKHDAGSLSVGPGSLVFIPAGEWHQLIASETGFDYIEFQAPFDFATTMDDDPLGKNWYIKGTDDGTGRPQRWVQS